MSSDVKFMAKKGGKVVQLLEQVNTALSLLKDLSELIKENPLLTLLILGGFTFNFNFNVTKQPDKEENPKKIKKKKLS